MKLKNFKELLKTDLTSPIRTRRKLNKNLFYLTIFTATFPLICITIFFFAFTSGMDLTAIFLFVISSSIVSLFFVFISFFRVYQYSLRRKILTKEMLPLLYLFFTISILRIIIDILPFMFGIVENFLDLPLRLIISVIPAILGIWIGFNLVRNNTSKNLKENEELRIQNAVEKILDSEFFLTTLRSTLPKGEEDEKYGLDYIPYMLNSNESRLEELKRTTRFYFTLTLCTGLLITIVVTSFGYLLINEQAAGTPKTLVEINQSLEELNKNVLLLSPNSTTNPSLRELESQFLNPLLSLDTKKRIDSNQFNTIREEIRYDILEVRQTNDWDLFSNSLLVHLSKLQNLPRSTDTTDTQEEYTKKLQIAVQKTQDFINKQPRILINLNETTEKLDNSIEDIEERIEDEDFRTTELIKRLGLSLIVSSFLLAILRYIAGIYRQHYQDMRKVQYESQIIRRFYIAMKSSFKAKEGSTPNQIIANFVNQSEFLYKQDNPKLTEELKSEVSTDLIKSLIEVLSRQNKG